MTTTWMVAMQDGHTTYFAGPTVEQWATMQGTASQLDAARRDAAVAVAVGAGLPYEVVERERAGFGTVPAFTDRRIAGTAALFAGKVSR